MPAATQKIILGGIPNSNQYVNSVLINRLIRLLLNFSLAKAITAIGTTPQKAKTTATATYLIDGEFKSKAATDDLWTLAGTVVAINSWQKYLLLLDTAGTASILEGTQSTVSAAAVVLPPPPDSKAIIGVLTVATAGAIFTPGTTSLAGISTFVDGIDPSLIATIQDTLTGTIVLA